MAAYFSLVYGHPPSNWAMVGRWSFELLTKSHLFLRDINDEAEKQNEFVVGWIVHYVVAVGYSAI